MKKEIFEQAQAALNNKKFQLEQRIDTFRLQESDVQSTLDEARQIDAEHKARTADYLAMLEKFPESPETIELRKWLFGYIDNAQMQEDFSPGVATLNAAVRRQPTGADRLLISGRSFAYSDTASIQQTIDIQNGKLLDLIQKRANLEVVLSGVNASLKIVNEELAKFETSAVTA